MRYGKIAIVMVLACFLACAAAYAQQQDTAKASDALPASTGEAIQAVETAKAVVAQPKDLTIYGEVQAVNVSANTMTVQYYDYDTDEEKSIELSIAGDTKIENAPGIGDIKKGDWADITYMTQNTKNVAKSVIVEKEEEVPAETMPEGEIKE